MVENCINLVNGFVKECVQIFKLHFKVLKLKKLLYILMLLTVTFTACRKDEHFTEVETEIPDSVQIDAPEPDPEPQDSTVVDSISFKMTGKISNELGTPIDQTTVNLYHGGEYVSSTTTDEWGKYTFEDLNASEHDYFLEADHSEFANNVKIRSIQDEDERADFILLDGSTYGNTIIDPTNTNLTSISGYIYEENQSPGSNMYVTAITYEEAITISYAVSDENGFYEMVVPKNQDMYIYFSSYCGEVEWISANVSNATQLEDTYVETSPTPVLFTGTVINCNGNPVENLDYSDIELSEFGSSTDFSINPNTGTIEITLLTCVNDDTQIPFFTDNESGQFFETILDPADETFELHLCVENLSTFVIDDEAYTFTGITASNCVCFIDDGIQLTYTSGSGIDVFFRIPNLTIENLQYNVGQTFAVESFVFSTLNNKYILSEEYDNTIYFTLDSVDEASGEFMTGNITGNIYDTSNQQIVEILALIEAQLY